MKKGICFVAAIMGLLMMGLCLKSLIFNAMWIAGKLIYVLFIAALAIVGAVVCLDVLKRKQKVGWVLLLAPLISFMFFWLFASQPLRLLWMQLRMGQILKHLGVLMLGLIGFGLMVVALILWSYFKQD